MLGEKRGPKINSMMGLFFSNYFQHPKMPNHLSVAMPSYPQNRNRIFNPSEGHTVRFSKQVTK